MAVAWERQAKNPGAPVLAVSLRAGEMLVVVPSAYRLWANHPAGVPIPVTLSACSLVLALEGAPRLILSAFPTRQAAGRPERSTAGAGGAGGPPRPIPCPGSDHHRGGD